MTNLLKRISWLSFDLLKIMQDHALNFSCLLVTYRNTKIPATETILFSKRLVKEQHTCRVNGCELGHLAEKNNLMHMTTAVKDSVPVQSL